MKQRGGNGGKQSGISYEGSVNLPGNGSYHKRDIRGKRAEADGARRRHYPLSGGNRAKQADAGEDVGRIRLATDVASLEHNSEGRTRGVKRERLLKTKKGN